MLSLSKSYHPWSKCSGSNHHSAFCLPGWQSFFCMTWGSQIGGSFWRQPVLRRPKRGKAWKLTFSSFVQALYRFILVLRFTNFMIGLTPFLPNLWDISISCGFPGTSRAFANCNTTCSVLPYASLVIPWISKEFFGVYLQAASLTMNLSGGKACLQGALRLHHNIAQECRFVSTTTNSTEKSIPFYNCCVV